MSRTVESAEVSWDVTEAIRETFEALENAKLIRGSYKVVEADISLHSLQLQQDYNKIIKMEIKRGDSCNPTAIGPLDQYGIKKLQLGGKLLDWTILRICKSVLDMFLLVTHMKIKLL